VSAATRHRAFVALRLGVSLALLAWLLGRAGLRSIGDVLAHADRGWLLTGVALGLASTTVQATQWHALLGAVGLRRTWLRSLRLVYVGYGFNTVLPSAVGGDVVRAVAVAEHPEERSPAAASVVLQRLCNFPGMIALLAVGLLASLADPFAGRMRPVAGIAAGAGLLIIVVAFSPLLGRLGRLRAMQRSRASRAVASLLARLDAVRTRPRVLGAAALRGTTFWTLQVLSQVCFMHAVGISAGLGYSAVVVTAVNLATLLPISINGYGVRESGYTAFLAVPGLASNAQAVAAGFLLAAQTLLWGLIGVACWAAPRLRGNAARTAAVVSAGVVLAGCGHGGPQNVTVAVAGAHTVADAPGGLGPVVAVADVPVTIDPVLFKGRVQVLTVSVIPGSHVTKGQALFSIDPAALQANADIVAAGLSAAQAAVTKEQTAINTADAQRSQATGIQAQIAALQRAIAGDQANIAAALASPPTPLPSGGATPPNTLLLQAQRQLNSDEAALGSAQGQLSSLLAQSSAVVAGGAQTVANLQGQVSIDQQLLSIAQGGSSSIGAPIEGDVVAVNVLPGQAATPGVPLVEIVDPSKLRATAKFPISEQSLVVPGAKAALTFSALPGAQLQGSVVSVIPVTSDGLTFQAVVEAGNPDHKVLPGLTAAVSVAASVQAAVAVPRLCVLDIDQNPYAYVVDAGNVAHRRTVQVGAVDADNVQVTSGLNAGDRCVVNGAQLLEDGSKVTVTATRA
jgi:RND family efflux transporter MFP subunit